MDGWTLEQLALQRAELDNPGDPDFSAMDDGRRLRVDRSGADSAGTVAA
jgi:hypothetical protein